MAQQSYWGTELKINDELVSLDDETGLVELEVSPNTLRMTSSETRILAYLLLQHAELSERKIGVRGINVY